MNREEWDNLSEQSKWEIFLTTKNDLWGKKINFLDEREDNSDECYYNGSHWIYYNSFEKKEYMYLCDGAFCVGRDSDNKTNENNGIMSVWDKVKNIKRLKKGMYIRFWSSEKDKKSNVLKGIITKINVSTGNIIFQTFTESGVSYNMFNIDYTGNIEVATIVNNKKEVKRNENRK